MLLRRVVAAIDFAAKASYMHTTCRDGLVVMARNEAELRTRCSQAELGNQDVAWTDWGSVLRSEHRFENLRQLLVRDVARVAVHAVAARVADESGDLLAPDANLRQPAGDIQLAKECVDLCDRGLCQLSP